MMGNPTKQKEKKHWCMITEDSNLVMHYIETTSQDELVDVIHAHFPETMIMVAQDNIVFGNKAVAWLDASGIGNELQINELASSLSEMCRSDRTWPHPLRGNVAFVNKNIWDSLE